MEFMFDVTVAANTTEAAPVDQDLILGPGVIVDAGVKFPSGCHGMVKVRLLQGRFQLYPRSKDQWITGDDGEVLIEKHYELPKEPYKLTLIACSPGTTYQHVITLRFIIIPKALASIYPVVQILEKIFSRLFGR